MGLCSLPEVKAQLGKTATVDDIELLAYIDAATAVIESYCGEVESRAVIEWAYPVADEIVLDAERVVSVTSLTGYSGTTAHAYTAAADPSAAGAYTYLLDPRLNGLIRRLGPGGYRQCFDGPVKVVYVAGFASVPAGLKLAAKLIVQHMWRTQNGGAGLPALSDEDLATSDGFDAPIPSKALGLMKAYRRVPGLA